MISARRIGPQYPDHIGMLNAGYSQLPRGGVTAPPMTATAPMPPENKSGLDMNTLMNAGRLVDSQTGLLGYSAAAMNPYGLTADIPLAAFESGLTPVAEYGGEMAGFFAPEAAGGIFATPPIAPAMEAASAAPVVEAGLGSAAAEGAAATAAADGGLLAGAGALGPLGLGALGIFGVGKLFDWW